jgi:dolichyl-phosphate beta-glucosyltransferase
VTKVTGPDLSVVIPAYREGRRLTESVQTVTQACRSLGRPFEVIVVVDGPEPETLRAAEPLSAQRGVTVLVNDRNRGKGFAVRRGVLQSSGRYVLFTDADLSIPIAHAGRFLEELERGADIVIASRYLDDAIEVGAPSRWRRPMSRAFNRLVRGVALPGVSDSQCGFKAFRATAARDVFGALRTEGFAFDVELLVLARQRGYRVVELPVTCVYYSQTSVRRVFDSLSMLRQLATIVWRR